MMDERDWLAERFEEHRPHLRAVAYRMLGSMSEADDAVQGAWLRLSRADTSSVENRGGWLTRMVARVCLDMLRSRKIATRGIYWTRGTGAASRSGNAGASRAVGVRSARHACCPLRRDRANRGEDAGRGAPTRQPRPASGARSGRAGN